jgi:phospholipase C
MKSLSKLVTSLAFGIVMVVAVSCGPASTPATNQTGTAAAQPTTPIQHLVVIFQENNSFDHYFGTYPKATNPPGEPQFIAAPDTPSVNGLTSSLLDHNPNLANPQRLDRSQAVTCDQDHDYTNEQKTFDNGKMDKFVQGVGPGCKDKGIVMDYYDGNTVTGLWNYAQHYSMSDAFFETTFGPSALGALNLISGQTHGATPDSIPGLVSQGTVIADARPAYDVCSKGTTVSMSGKNVGDLLNEKQITWGWFTGGFTPSSTAGGKIACNTVHKNVGGIIQADYIPHHEPFQFFKSTANPNHLPPTSVSMIGKTDQANHQYDLSDFWAAVNAGNMPAVSFLKAPAYQDGHAQYSDPLDEQNFLVNTINSLQKQPTWKNTAVIITYDDSDGWYDHVASPISNPSNDPKYDALNGSGACGGTVAQGAFEDRCSFGPRLPILIISPYAKQNFVDHTTTNQASILRFIEDNWKLGRIGNQSFDQTSGTLDNMFNLTVAARTDIFALDPKSGEPASSSTQVQSSTPTTQSGVTSTQTGTASAQAGATTVSVTTDNIGNFAFTPATLTISVGTTVTWKNASAVAHTVTSDDGVSFDSGAIAAGGNFSFQFTKAGSYAYHCDIHPYMKATIVVK